MEWRFVPERLVPAHATPLPITTFPSEDAGLLFELLPARSAPDEIVVVVVGDSSVAGLFGVGGLSGSLYLRLAGAFPGRRVRLVDLGIRGLYARDAVFLIARAMALEPDAVIWAVSPRVLPFDAEPAWATTIEDVALDPHVVARLGLRTSLSFVAPSHLGRTLVYSLWPAARLRGALADAVVASAPAPLAALLAPFVPRPAAPAFAETPRADHEGARWTPDRFGFDRVSDDVRAFDAVLALCAHDRRCLLYHAPVNAAAAHGFAPGFVDAFVAEAARRAAAHDVAFVDLHARIPPADFIEHADGPDALHLTNAGAQALAGAVAQIVAPIVARGAR